MIFCLTHKEAGFEGVVLGVDFHNGRGTTSSPYDAVRLVREGCRIEDPAAQEEVRRVAIKLAAARRAKLAEIKMMDEFERSPAYTEWKLRKNEELKEAEERRRRENRPRRRFHR